jgi:hypothetical protein
MKSSRDLERTTEISPARELGPSEEDEKADRAAAIRASMAHVQMQFGASRSSAPADAEQQHAIAEDGVSGPGGKIPHRDEMEQAVGANLDGVKMHVGGKAADAADALGAEAFAMGNDVAFREQPDKQLLAHELTHVRQQRDGVQLAGGVGAEGDAYEREADEVAAVHTAMTTARSPMPSTPTRCSTARRAPGTSASMASQSSFITFSAIAA